MSRQAYVALVGGDRFSVYTLRLLLESECPPSGIVVETGRGLRSRIRYERRIFRRHGARRRLSQMTVGVLHRMLDGASDRQLIESLYRGTDYRGVISRASSMGVPLLETDSYGSSEALQFVRNRDPSFLLCHTPYWINREVRDLVAPGMVIGSHPGSVPWFRGAHSAFWCRYLGQEELNGYSIFCLEAGVDSGPLIKRQMVPYSQEASYRGNDYLLLEAISRELVNTVRELSSGVYLQTTPQSPLEPTQVYRAPGLVDYVRFRFQEARKRRLVGESEEAGDSPYTG